MNCIKCIKCIKYKLYDVLKININYNNMDYTEL